ncbi:MAG: carbohydrate-binding domain-containing protein [Treponema sp.]|nr:carbohydrate-binding domain-containing protein [Treponema sp.]
MLAALAYSSSSSSSVAGGQTANLVLKLQSDDSSDDGSSRKLLVSTISKVEVTVSSSDMSTITSTSEDLADGIGSLSVEGIPVGSNRIISVQAYTKSTSLKNICLSIVKDLSAGDNEITINWSTTALGNVYAKLLELGVDIANLSDDAETALADAIPDDTQALLVDTEAIANDYYNSGALSVSNIQDSENYILKPGKVTFSYYGADGFTAMLNEPNSSEVTSCKAGETITIENAAPGAWILYLVDSENNILSTTTDVAVKSDETTELGILPYDGIMVVVNATENLGFNTIYYWNLNGSSSPVTYPGETMDSVGSYYVMAFPGTNTLSLIINNGNTGDSNKLCSEDLTISAKGVYLLSTSGYTLIGKGTTTTSDDSDEDEYNEDDFANAVFVKFGTTSSWATAEDGTYTEISTTKATIGDNIKIQYTKDDDGNNTGLIEINAKKATAPTAFYFTGTLSTGGVKIQTNAEDEISVNLNGVTMTSSNYPCFDITKGSKAYVILSGTNSLTDGRSYGIGYGEEYSTSSSDTYTDDDGNTVSCTVVKEAVYEGSDHSGTLYCKGDLIFSGSGTLAVTESYKHCIASKGFIQVNGGSIDYTGNGAINVSTSSASTNYYVKKANGISVDGIISSTNNGWIKIYGGTFTANTTYGKGLKAKWDSSEDTETDVTTGTPDPSIYIYGGTITITAAGTGYSGDNTSGKTYYFYDANGVSCHENFKCAAEGIESNSSINISGGTISVTAADDALNTSLTGGYLYAYSSGGDGLDSNGNINVSGGTIVALAPTGSEDALDCGDRYSTSITGGLIAAASGSSSATLSSSKTSAVLAVNYTHNSVISTLREAQGS